MADDDLFEEALAGFTKQRQSRTPATANISSASTRDAAATVNDASTAMSTACFDPLKVITASRTSAAASSSAPAAVPSSTATEVAHDTAPSARPAAFDPLPRKAAGKGKGKAFSAPAAVPAVPPDIFNQPGMPAELASLLQELHKVSAEEATGGPDGSLTGLEQLLGSLAGPMGGGGGPRDPGATSKKDLEGTMAALANQMRALNAAERSQNPAGDDEAGIAGPLQQLAESLDGLTDSPQGFVDTIMQQLLSKDVLYQPMKEIGARYPAWLEQNKDQLGPDELAKYEQQYETIQRICTLYESPDQDYGQLVMLLQQMQQCGQPPADIVSELAPGLEFDADGLPKMPSLADGGTDIPPELAKELGQCCMQ